MKIFSVLYVFVLFCFCVFTCLVFFVGGVVLIFPYLTVPVLSCGMWDLVP